jgi:hypothetical protein
MGNRKIDERGKRKRTKSLLEAETQLDTLYMVTYLPTYLGRYRPFALYLPKIPTESNLTT